MTYEIYNEDCLSGMKRLEDNSVDCVLCDLPYNMTDCEWDKSAIDLPSMWEQFKRILKPYNSVVLFAGGKFTHKLIASNFDWYKYKWIWVKNTPTMFVQAKNAPMRKFEEILIFSDGSINHASRTSRRMKYNPQGVVPCDLARKNGGRRTTYVTGFQDKLVATPSGIQTIIKKKRVSADTNGLSFGRAGIQSFANFKARAPDAKARAVAGISDKDLHERGRAGIGRDDGLRQYRRGGDKYRSTIYRIRDRDKIFRYSAETIKQSGCRKTASAFLMET